jgi:hypothetical protein
MAEVEVKGRQLKHQAGQTGCMGLESDVSQKSFVICAKDEVATLQI